MRQALQHPARIGPLAFLVAIGIGTALLMLPAAREGPESASFVAALFTATSAVCVTGLVVVDTPVYWTDFGHVLITALTQLGGYGIITMATLLTLIVSDRLGLRTRLLAQAEGRSLGLANVRQVLVRVAVVMLACEAALAVVLTGRWWLAYDYSFGEALWQGVFHAVSAFNNGGFTLYSDSMMGFAQDWWIILTITLGVVVGGLGFPVLFELARQFRQVECWTVHTRLTVFGSAALLVVGFAAMLAFEWRNPATMGPMGVGEKVLASIMQGAMPRSGGFNSVDIGALQMESHAVSIALMFIGGGSASTAGGIKVATFFLLAAIVWAEAKGEPDVVVGRRRIPDVVHRLAISVVMLAVTLVSAGVLALILATDGAIAFERVLFEVMSAFATVGLSTGITGDLPDSGQIILVILMFVGRVGPITVTAALALTSRPRHYRYPEERPIIG